MNFNRKINKIKKRMATDTVSVFCYRVMFFLMRKLIEFYDAVHYKFIVILHKEKFLVKNILGFKMILNTEDLGLSKELVLSGIREPYHTKLIRKLLKDGDVVIDIGANIGYYTLMSSKIVGHKGKVYAIEPVTENLELAKKSIALNNLTNVKTYRYAIGDKEEIINILLSKKKNWCAVEGTVNMDENKFNSKESVRMITLDNFLKEKDAPNLIRMDVEGYESNIITGMVKLTKSKAPLIILMELHSSILDDRGISILKYFEENGFFIKYFFRERPPIMLNKNSLTRKIYYFLGKKINGVYEFKYNDISVRKIISDNLLTDETFHVCFQRK